MTGPESFHVQRMGAEEGPYGFPQLQSMVRAGSLKADTLVRRASGGEWFRAAEVPGLISEKEWLVAMLLSFFAGTLGVDRFYVGHILLGFLKLITFGGLGLWWLIDVILFARNSVKDDKGLPLRK